MEKTRERKVSFFFVFFVVLETWARLSGPAVFNPFAGGTGSYKAPSGLISRTVKSKAMCTLGPACVSKRDVARLLVAGMNIARFNASHGTHAQWQVAVDTVRAACSETGAHCALLLDIRGPEIRIGQFEKGGVQLSAGQTFTFRTNFVVGDASQVSIMSWSLWKHMRKDDKIIVDYGLVSFTVVATRENEIVTVVDNSNFLGDNKHVRVKHADGSDEGESDFRSSLLSYRDTEDIAFAVRNRFDFIATPACHRTINAYNAGERDIVYPIAKLPGVVESKIRLLIKCATAYDVNNVDALLRFGDGVLLCRSELAVSVPLEKVATLQKTIAHRCNMAGKPYVVMNHVLASMTKQPLPTRAEATDVANLILDGADCLVLTTPCASGAYPAETVTTLKAIARETELDMDARQRYVERRNEQIGGGCGTVSRADSMASSAAKMSWDLEAAAIICFTETGATAQRLAQYRPHCVLICVTTNERAARQMQLTFGTLPIVVGSLRNPDALTDHVVRELRPTGVIKSGDVIVRLAGTLAEEDADSHVLSVFHVK